MNKFEVSLQLTNELSVRYIDSNDVLRRHTYETGHSASDYSLVAFDTPMARVHAWVRQDLVSSIKDTEIIATAKMAVSPDYVIADVQRTVTDPGVTEAHVRDSIYFHMNGMYPEGKADLYLVRPVQ